MLILVIQGGTPAYENVLKKNFFLNKLTCHNIYCIIYFLNYNMAKFGVDG